MNEARCDNCQFWKRDKARYDASWACQPEERRGECRRRVPIVVPGDSSQWPLTLQDDWCGDFEAAAPASPEPADWQAAAIREFRKAMDIACKLSGTVDVHFEYDTRVNAGASTSIRERTGAVRVLLLPGPVMPDGRFDPKGRRVANFSIDWQPRTPVDETTTKAMTQ